MIDLTGVALWVIGSVVLALAGLWVTKRLSKPFDVKGKADFLLATVTIVGTLVSVVLGLLVSSSVDQYRELEASIDKEATSIGDVFRMSRGLPAKTAAALEALCIQYCQETARDEWPSMKLKQPSSTVTATYAKLNDTIVTFHPANEGETNLQEQLISSLGEVGHARRERVVAVQSKWLDQFLPILLACATIVVVISYLYVESKPSKLDTLLVSFVAIALGSNIGLMLMMNASARHHWNKAPEEFEFNVEMMTKYKEAPLQTP